MPTTQIEFPILQHFFCVVESRTGMPPQPLDATPVQLMAAQNKQDGDDKKPKQLPKGVVLGPDGKPCRSCTSFASWAALTKQQNPSSPSTSTSQSRAFTTSTTSSPPIEPPPNCPPDVDALGRATWTLLHTITANYPISPTSTQQTETKQFLNLFGKMYPCWTCAEDFRSWMNEGGEGGRNAPRVSSREEFGRWMCEAHNAVNEKLGKERFDCGRWEERWRTGWRDGSCD